MSVTEMSVADSRGRRLDAATGVVAGVMFLVGFGIQGKPPDPGDPVPKIASYLADHRGAILTGDFLIAVGAAFFIWFLGSLRSYLRAGEGGEGRLSAASFLGGGVGTAVVLAAVALQSALVLHVGTLTSAPIVRFGFDSVNALVTVGGAALAVAVAGASCSAARSGALSPTVYWTGSVIAGLQIATLAGLFTKTGFFAAGKELALIAFVALSLWYIAVAVVVMRRQGVPPVARAAP